MLITKDGKPVAALVDVAMFERIRRLRDAFTRLTDALGRAYAGVDPTVAQTEIDEAVRAARRTRAGAAARADWLVTGDAPLLALAEPHPIISPSDFAARFVG